LVLLSRYPPVKDCIISLGPREDKALVVGAEDTRLFFPCSTPSLVRSPFSFPIPTASTRTPIPTIDFKEDMYSSREIIPSTYDLET
jgi:hypothetical protein